MGEASTAVAGEIDRIVNSPYPTQLKSLRDALGKDTAEASIHQWALAKPCQVQRLASCVLEALPHWSYVLEIITALCCSRVVRDTFLSQQPHLVHDIIRHAINANDLKSHHAEAAVAVLSQSLPDHTPMPTDAQTFFVQVFNTAASNPSVSTLKPVYTLLRGSAAHLLGILSSKAMLQLEDQIFSILRSVKGDTSSLSLYCLAILRITMTASEEEFRASVSTYDTQELLASVSLASSRWTPDAVRQFFHGEKAQRTAQLVVLRAMWACTSSTGEHYDERMESLRLANEIVEAIPVDLRATWRKCNTLLVRKLDDKIAAPELDPSLRYQGLYFLLQLTKRGFVPAIVADGLRQVVSKPANFAVAVADGGRVDITLLVECGIFDHSTTATVIQNVVDFLSSADCDSIMHSSKPVQQLLTQLSSTVPHDDGVVEGVMLAVDVISCGHKLQQLRTCANNANSHHSTTGADVFCKSAVQSVYNGMVHALSKLFLVAAQCSRPLSYSLSNDTYALILGLYTFSAQPKSPCMHARRSYIDPPQDTSVVQVELTPQEDAADWRSALESHLISRNRSEAATMSAILHRAVSELEDRCYNVERPLQEEQQRRREVQRKYDELNKAYAEVEREVMDRDIAISTMKAEKEQYLSELADSKAEIEKLVAKVKGLERELNKAIEQAEDDKTEAKNERQTEEMQHSAICARQEEDIEMLRGQLTESSAEVENMRNEVLGLRDQLRHATAAGSEANDENQRLRLAVQDLETATTSLRAELETLTESRDQLASKAAHLRNTLAATVESHHVELSSFEEESRLERDSLIEQHSKEATALSIEADSLRAKLSESETKLSNASSLNDQQIVRLKKRERKITELQADVERWQEKCSQKDKQIEEANAMRSNLMAAMGLGSLQHQPLPQSSLPFRPSRPSTARETEVSQVGQEDPSPPTPLSGDDETVIDADAEMAAAKASFASTGSSTESRSGPTPKRARPRRSVNALTPAKTTRLTAVSTRSKRSEMAGQSTAKRQPLAHVATNAVAKGSMKTPSKGIVAHELDDETTFNGSELFGGTQG